jgi:hypothetical protein
MMIADLFCTVWQEKNKNTYFQRPTFAVSGEDIILEFKRAQGAVVPFKIPHAVVYKFFMVPPLSDRDVACF